MKSVSIALDKVTEDGFEYFWYLEGSMTCRFLGCLHLFPSGWQPLASFRSGAIMQHGGSVSVSAQAQEQASADLVLLQQELGKSKRVTTRMTALLTSCDDRLARLDKSVVPIYRSTKDLGKIQRNIEAALLAIDAVVGTSDLVDREQQVIDSNPRDDLSGYQASLARLKQAMDSIERSANAAAPSPSAGGVGLLGNKGKEREGTLGRVKGLIEAGCRKVGDLFLDLVLEASPKHGWPDIGSWEQGDPFPELMTESTIRRLAALLGFIHTILGQNSPVELDLQQGYGDIRGMYMATTLNSVGKEAIDGVEVQTKSGSSGGGRIPAFGRRGFGRFIDAMFAMAKVSLMTPFFRGAWLTSANSPNMVWPAPSLANI